MYKLQCLLFFILIQFFSTSAFSRSDVKDYTVEAETLPLKTLCAAKDASSFEESYLCDDNQIVCQFGLKENSTKVTFEKILVSSHFCEEVSPLNPNRFPLDTSNRMTIYLSEKQINLAAIGISTKNTQQSSENDSGLTDKNFFDYLWIRIKILIFIVLIYVLEQF